MRFVFEISSVYVGNCLREIGIRLSRIFVELSFRLGVFFLLSAIRLAIDIYVEILK